MKEKEKFGVPINSIMNLVEENKLKFEVNLIKIRRIKGPMIKLKELLKFKDPIDSIKVSMKEKNQDFELLGPKLHKL